MIADELNKLKQTKASIKQALIDKGQNPTDEFASYADDIRAIEAIIETGELDWSSIGYNKQPEIIKDSLEFAKEVYNNNSTDYVRVKLKYLPNFDYTKIIDLYAGTTPFSYNEGLLFCDVVDLSVTSDNGKSWTAHSFFYNDTALLQVNTLKIKDNTPMTSAFSGCKSLSKVGEIIGKPSDITTTFKNCNYLKKIPYIDTSLVKSLANTFYGCWWTEDWTELNNWDLSNVTNISNAFYECYDLQELDLSNATKINTITTAFYCCSKLQELILPNIVLTNSSMATVFASCRKLKSIDLSKIDVSKLSSANITDMFSYCESLENIDFQSWEGLKISTMRNTFNNCKKLKVIDISPLDTTTAKFAALCCDCTELESFNGYLDYNNYSASGNMNFSFTNCPNLRQINTIYNLGKNQYIDFKNSPYLGVVNEDYPNARIKLTELLVTNLYDKVANGLSTGSMRLNEATVALLTEEEIAQITAKGYTIS